MEFNEKKEKLTSAFALLGVELTDTQVNQFIMFHSMLEETNKVMNLTAITEFDEVVVKHFLDSCLIYKTGRMQGTESMIDVGTGAGFPGIPLKILYPDLKITLLDSLNKRIGFLNRVVKELGLTGVTTVHGRAEDVARDPGHREQYDICVSRAVANLSTLSEYCIPFLRVGGSFVPYKTGKNESEVEDALFAIHKFGCIIEKEEKIMLPTTDMERMLILMKKNKTTPKQFPRKAGLPGKEPLGSKGVKE